MHQIKDLEELVVAIDPMTRRPRVFYKTEESMKLGVLAVPRYRAFEGVSRDYTMSELRFATDAFGTPVHQYTRNKTYQPADPKQMNLFGTQHHKPYKQE